MRNVFICVCDLHLRVFSCGKIELILPFSNFFLCVLSKLRQVKGLRISDRWNRSVLGW